LPFEQHFNPYWRDKNLILITSLFEKMFVKYSQGFVVMPGLGLWTNCLKQWLWFKQKKIQDSYYTSRKEFLVRINWMDKTVLIEENIRLDQMIWIW
jgi:predicted Rossmann-fold nucleotide-binding protein